MTIGSLRSAEALLALALTLAACTSEEGPGDGATPPSKPRVAASVVVGLPGEPATLDPYSRLASELTWWVVRPVYPSLYSLLPDGRTVAALSSSLEREGSGVRVVLREAAWSNGDPITARDVVASVRRARSPSGFARLTEARALGPRELLLRGRIDTTRGWERALATVAFVLPLGRADRSIAGGPLRIASVVPGLEVSYRRNPRWWGGRVALRSLVVRYTQGVEMLFGLLERGELDAASIPSTVNLGRRLDEIGIDHAAALGWESIYLDVGGAAEMRATLDALYREIDRRLIEEGLIRDSGRISNELDPGPGAMPPAPKRSTQGSLPTELIQLGAPLGDELLELMQRIIQSQLQNDDLEVELATVEPYNFYGEWMIEDPTDLALRRAGGAPAENDYPAREESFPLFNVETVAAWRPGLEGLRPNPTFDGLLWNVEEWRVAGS